MDPEYSIFVYSKYSVNCKKIFQLVNETQVDLEKIMGNKLRLLCIDNENVRKRLKGNELSIDVVPCILSIFINGVINKYEGEKAFEWIKVLLSKIVPPKPVPQPIPVQQIPKNIEKKNIPQDKPTSIEDLPFDEEETDRHRNLPQPKRIRDDKQGYVEDENFFPEEAKEPIKPNNGKIDIKSAAEALKRARDETEKEINTPSRRPLDMRGPN